MRVGMHVGSPEDGVHFSKLLKTMNDLMARLLDITRVGLCAGPIILQCFYIHDVDLKVWIFKVLLIYALIGAVAFLTLPEQLYNGLGLSTHRWVFDHFYPELAHIWAGGAKGGDSTPGLVLNGQNMNELTGKRCRLRWHGTGKYLAIDTDGWTHTAGESFASSFLLQQTFVKETKVPDTYTFRVMDEHSDFYHTWLGFQPVNHLRFGGWLGSYKDPKMACPYKVILDSACLGAPGSCKLLCAWPNMPPPSQRFCTGFYLAEQLSGSRSFVGHAPDREAALLELVVVVEKQL